MREIAEVLDVSESRVCQIHRRAMPALRSHLVQRTTSIKTAAKTCLDSRPPETLKPNIDTNNVDQLSTADTPESTHAPTSGINTTADGSQIQPTLVINVLQVDLSNQTATVQTPNGGVMLAAKIENADTADGSARRAKGSLVPIQSNGNQLTANVQEPQAGLLVNQQSSTAQHIAAQQSLLAAGAQLEHGRIQAAISNAIHHNQPMPTAKGPKQYSWACNTDCTPQSPRHTTRKKPPITPAFSAPATFSSNAMKCKPSRMHIPSSTKSQHSQMVTSIH